MENRSNGYTIWVDFGGVWMWYAWILVVVVNKLIIIMDG